MMDRITISLEADDEIKAAVDNSADYIKEETLADSISYTEVADKFDINGHDTGICVKRV